VARNHGRYYENRKSGAIWRYEKCVENVHPIKLRCKTPEPRFSKIKLFRWIMEKRPAQFFEPTSEDSPSKPAFFPGTAAFTADPLCLVMSNNCFSAAVTRPCSFLLAYVAPRTFLPSSRFFKQPLCQNRKPVLSVDFESRMRIRSSVPVRYLYICRTKLRYVYVFHPHETADRMCLN
jgi:hypothetical protein